MSFGSTCSASISSSASSRTSPVSVSTVVVRRRPMFSVCIVRWLP
jgi:hypothetical protein